MASHYSKKENSCLKKEPNFKTNLSNTENCCKFQVKDSDSKKNDVELENKSRENNLYRCKKKKSRKNERKNKSNKELDQKLVKQDSCQDLLMHKRKDEEDRSYNKFKRFDKYNRNIKKGLKMGTKNFCLDNADDSFLQKYEDKKTMTNFLLNQEIDNIFSETTISNGFNITEMEKALYFLNQIRKQIALNKSKKCLSKNTCINCYSKVSKEKMKTVKNKTKIVSCNKNIAKKNHCNESICNKEKKSKDENHLCMNNMKSILRKEVQNNNRKEIVSPNNILKTLKNTSLKQNISRINRDESMLDNNNNLKQNSKIGGKVVLNYLNQNAKPSLKGIKKYRPIPIQNSDSKSFFNKNKLNFKYLCTCQSKKSVETNNYVNKNLENLEIQDKMMGILFEKNGDSYIHTRKYCERCYNQKNIKSLVSKCNIGNHMSHNTNKNTCSKNEEGCNKQSNCYTHSKYTVESKALGSKVIDQSSGDYKVIPNKHCNNSSKYFNKSKKINFANILNDTSSKINSNQNSGFESYIILNKQTSNSKINTRNIFTVCGENNVQIRDKNANTSFSKNDKQRGNKQGDFGNFIKLKSNPEHTNKVYLKDMNEICIGKNYIKGTNVENNMQEINLLYGEVNEIDNVQIFSNILHNYKRNKFIKIIDNENEINLKSEVGVQTNESKIPKRLSNVEKNNRNMFIKKLDESSKIKNEQDERKEIDEVHRFENNFFDITFKKMEISENLSKQSKIIKFDPNFNYNTLKHFNDATEMNKRYLKKEQNDKQINNLTKYIASSNIQNYFGEVDEKAILKCDSFYRNNEGVKSNKLNKKDGDKFDLSNINIKSEEILDLKISNKFNNYPRQINSMGHDITVKNQKEYNISKEINNNINSPIQIVNFDFQTHSLTQCTNHTLNNKKCKPDIKKGPSVNAFGDTVTFQNMYENYNKELTRLLGLNESKINLKADILNENSIGLKKGIEVDKVINYENNNINYDLLSGKSVDITRIYNDLKENYNENKEFSTFENINEKSTKVNINDQDFVYDLSMKSIQIQLDLNEDECLQIEMTSENTSS